MPDMLVSALVQAPFVLVMAYLMLRLMMQLNEREQEWQQFITARDAEWQEFSRHIHDVMTARLDKQTGAIEYLSLLLMTYNADARQEGGVPHAERKKSA